MAGDTHSVTDQTAIESTFPPRMQRMSGQPTLLDLLTAFRHIVKCAGAFTSRYDQLNLLYIAVPEGLWPMYTTRGYPAIPTDPGDQPQYNINGSTPENNTRKDAWLLERKYFAEDQHMNRALIDRFLDLLEDAITNTFKENQLLLDPKIRFQDAFNYFFNIYGTPNDVIDK